MKASKKFIGDLVVSGGFIALGVLAPGSALMSASGFTANLTGLATGVGVGWLVKTFVDHKTGEQARKNQ